MYMGTHWQYTSTRQLVDVLMTKRSNNYCGRQSGTLFIVPTYNHSLVNEIYNHWIYISGTRVVSGSK